LEGECVSGGGLLLSKSERILGNMTFRIGTTVAYEDSDTLFPII
jgi:hypothetical protein